jgi:hypothetical protein
MCNGVGGGFYTKATKLPVFCRLADCTTVGSFAWHGSPSGGFADWRTGESPLLEVAAERAHKLLLSVAVKRRSCRLAERTQEPLKSQEGRREWQGLSYPRGPHILTPCSFRMPEIISGAWFRSAEQGVTLI